MRGRVIVIVSRDAIVFLCTNRFIVIVIQSVIAWNFGEVGVRTRDQWDWWLFCSGGRRIESGFHNLLLIWNSRISVMIAIVLVEPSLQTGVSVVELRPAGLLVLVIS